MSDCTESNLGINNVIGLALIAQGGLLSLAFVLAFFGFVMHNAIIQRRHPFQSHVDIYIISLFAASVSQGLYSVMNWKWAVTGKVMCGAYCDAQGILSQFGETGISQSTLAISIHTFCVIFFRWDPPRSKRVPLCVVSLIWLYNACFVAVGLGKHRGRGGKDAFYVPAPYWCWLYPSTATRIFSEYLWLNLAVFASVILYVLLFFAVLGYIDVRSNGNRWYQYRVTLIRQPEPTQQREALIAKKMLWYPLANAFLVLADIFRWKLIENIDPNVPLQDVSFTWIAVTRVLYSLTGVVDVMLFTLTRPSILLFNAPAVGTSAMIPQNATTRGARERTVASIAVNHCCASHCP
ncbi:hypothetical protein BOTBODRAFT_53377 [Botryobasidium botryosum FD-172 SS1]|uniref:Glucose receptor Git3 N-terminal domain-containing protein n=1 Tax=Botryobasidium botryosum (strain FD-172 SS1) TaxID=930990 RepID=A0A067N0B9_BOTB1|nr:hypothetical protein BOTBODRAFT_53377 [Botryobasidium botryosum FD-172 SS1]